MYTIRASQDVLIRAPATQIFGVLTDYEHFAQMFEAVQSVHVHARDEGVCQVTFVIHVLVHIECKMRLVEDYPLSLRFTRTDANLLQHMTGSATLTEDASGAACTLVFAFEVKLAGQIPRAVEQRLVTQRLPAMLEQVRRAAERQNVA